MASNSYLEVARLPGVDRRPVPYRVSGNHHRNEPGLRPRQGGGTGVASGLPHLRGADQKIRRAAHTHGKHAGLGENLPGPHLQTIHT